MEALRVLSVEQSRTNICPAKNEYSDATRLVRRYHSTYYVPNNLSLIVAGTFSEGTSSLLKVVQKQIEPNIILHHQNQGPHPPGWKRPFLETASAARTPLRKIIRETVDFPEEDESMGELILQFSGPAPNQYLERKVVLAKPETSVVDSPSQQALEILGQYLTSSAVAPLKKEFIEIDSPLWFVSPEFHFSAHYNCGPSAHTFLLTRRSLRH